MDDERNQPPTRPDTQDDGNMPDTDQPPSGSGPQLDYEPNRRRGPFVPDGDEPTTLQRALWIALGALLGIIGMFIVFLMYRKRDPMTFWIAMRTVMIGVAIGLIIEIFLFQMITGQPAATGGATGPGSPGWTSTNF